MKTSEKDWTRQPCWTDHKRQNIPLKNGKQEESAELFQKRPGLSDLKRDQEFVGVFFTHVFSLLLLHVAEIPKSQMRLKSLHFYPFSPPPSFSYMTHFLTDAACTAKCRPAGQGWTHLTVCGSVMESNVFVQQEATAKSAFSFGAKSAQRARTWRRRKHTLGIRLIKTWLFWSF